MQGEMIMYSEFKHKGKFSCFRRSIEMNRKTGKKSKHEMHVHVHVNLVATLPTHKKPGASVSQQGSPQDIRPAINMFATDHNHRARDSTTMHCVFTCVTRTFAC